MNISASTFSPGVQFSLPRAGQMKATADEAAASSAAEEAPKALQAGGQSGQSVEALSEEESKELESLKARDREVRDHEQAHLAAAGGLAISGASFSYQRGPDGVNYAIGGEVRIDTSPGRTPEETIRRAQTIRAAALAPAEPSGQDRSVAAQASQMEAEARAELAASDAEAGSGSAGRQAEQTGERPDAGNSSELAALRQTQLERHYQSTQRAEVGSRIDVAA